MVKEIIEEGFGEVVYTYTSPTHWSHDGVCRVVERAVAPQASSPVWRVSRAPDVSLRWGSGGVNKDATQKEIADAMSQAFRMASERITEIENRLNKQERNNEQTV